MKGASILIAAGATMVLAGCGPNTPPPNGAGGAPAGTSGAASQPGAEESNTADEPAAEGTSGAAGEGAADTGDAATDGRYVLGSTMNRIDGTAESLEGYKGKVVMVVNVATECGLTPQYEALQALYEARAGDGLVILGFPANNFGGQEPGTNEEIVQFCTGEYGVTFPMFEKISVTGDDQHPLYATLSQEGGPPTWNFTKYLVDREGRVVARFEPRTAPDDPALVARVEELLGE